MMTAKAIVMMVTVIAIMTAFSLWALLRYMTARAKARAEARSGADRDYLRLAEEYRRLTDIAVTSQEHTELKLGELSVRIDQLREQLESVQFILKEVE